MSEKKEKKILSLEDFTKEMKSKFGKNSVITASEADAYTDVIPFSSESINDASGIGGLPIDKVVELIGWESSGKSTIANDLIGNAQKKFKDCQSLLIDRENSFDKFYAETLGVDTANVTLGYPESLEDCYDTVEMALDTKLFKLIIVDSLTAFSPDATIDGNSAMGKESRINSDRMRMVTEKVKDSGCLVIFINQMREKIGVMFGSPETTSGGNAMKFYAHMRIMMRRSAIDQVAQRNTISIQFIKNKLAPPFGKAEVDIIWGKGFDLEQEAITKAIKANIIELSGKTYSYNGEKIAVGLPKLKVFFKENDHLFQEIREKVKGINVAFDIEETADLEM